jgi:nicotinic acid mononucleotide adenylyltransferase
LRCRLPVLLLLLLHTHRGPPSSNSMRRKQRLGSCPRSSSAVRQAVFAGGEALEDLPTAVAAYIREHGLYR